MSFGYEMPRTAFDALCGYKYYVKGPTEWSDVTLPVS
jgi:hypothetical protein